LIDYVYLGDIFIAINDDDQIACKAALVSNPDSVNFRHPRGWTPLMAAVVQRRRRIIKTLLECGADVNAVDEYDGRTNSSEDHSLHRSIRYEEFSACLKPDTNYRGCTALHYAVLVNDEALVKLLLDSGADPSMENIHGHLPIDLCKSDSIARLLGSNVLDRRQRQGQSQTILRIPLEQRLRDNIVGQESAIEIVTATIRRKEKNWHDDEHPLVMLFMGSSGVGKTEVAKQVAAHLHSNNPRAFIRLDMSEYQEKHEVSKLFGAPPGYVGFDNGGQLTNTLMHYPNAVVLFDEIEKAHPDVMTALLQLFDEGRMTSGRGETVNCKDAIFIMTSNVGSQVIAENAELIRSKTGDATSSIQFSREFLDNVMRPLLRKYFIRDEFLGRINEVVYFLPFSPSELKELVLRYLNRWKEMAITKHSISLTWDQDVIDHIIAGYDLYYGARSIAYEIDRQILSHLAIADEKGQLKPNCGVHLKASDCFDKVQSCFPLFILSSANQTPGK
uniref:AAA domain-containing protein n=1 Tax=Rodentolepis nana TaxID=102285 RepID=A0A0R3T1I0_RODNA